MIISRVTFFVLLVFSVAASGQVDSRWGISAGAVDNDYDSGLNFSASYWVESHNIALVFNFLDLNMFSGEPEGYHKETIIQWQSNMQERGEWAVR